MSSYDWIIGIGLMFSFALILMYITKRDLIVFFIYLVIMNAFVVWGGFLELWTLITSILGLTFILILNNRRGGL